MEYSVFVIMEWFCVALCVSAAVDQPPAEGTFPDKNY